MKAKALVQPPIWKRSIWERNSVDPALLRAPIMFILFIALWGVNVLIFERLQLPYHRVLSSKPQSLPFLFYSALFFAMSYAVIMTAFSNYFFVSVEISVFMFYGLLFMLVFIPAFPGHDGRGCFFRLLYTVLLPGSSISFAEVVLADVFTSLAKVFKDIGTFIIVLYAKISRTDVLDHHDNAMILLAVLGSLPFLIRVRQCTVQLWGAPDFSTRIPITLNTLKYFTAFPPIWLTAAASLGYFHPSMPLLITVFATINSLYSYLWDILMDWGLIAYFREKSYVHRPPRRLIHGGFLAVTCVLNFLLRFTWTANFFPFFSSFHPATLVFMIEVVEVLRRWVWIIFRVEWEIIVQTERGLLKNKDDSPDIVNSSSTRVNGEK